MKTLAILAATLLPVTAMASGFNVGADVGMYQQANIQSEIYKDNTSTQPAGRVYAEYDADLFALGASYNVFTNMEFDSALVDETDKLRIQGPEVYGKIKYNFDGVEPFVKFGAMYAMAHGTNMWLQDTNNFSPTAGFGVNWHVADGFMLKAGYDKYWNIYDSPESGLNTDVDFYYVGMGLSF